MFNFFDGGELTIYYDFRQWESGEVCLLSDWWRNFTLSSCGRKASLLRKSYPRGRDDR